MAMNSALYYPHTDVRSEDLMKSALLTWDKLHTIIPHQGYKPDYGNNKMMAEAWELIGEGLVAKPDEQQLAHDSIAETLRTGLPMDFQFLAAKDRKIRPYEIWPQKFAAKTWDLMMEHELTGPQLPNADYPFTHEGGVLVMSKLADAIAGTHYARVTDQSLAFGMTADRTPDQAAEQAVLMTLDIIDGRTLSLKELIEFRKREEKEGPELRLNYARAVEKHVAEVKTLTTQRQRDDKNNQFKTEMERDRKLLGKAITGNKRKLVIKSVIVPTIVGVGALAAGLGGPAAIIAAGTAAVGTSATEIADKLSKLLDLGFAFGEKQREIMAEHPMAYMYQLKRT